jgi:hypothetical protein
MSEVRTNVHDYFNNKFIESIEPIELNDSEKKEIATTLKSNWSLLRFIVFYLSLDTDEKRKDLMRKIAYDTLKNSPAAIAKNAIIELHSHICSTNPSDFKEIFPILFSTIAKIVRDTGACDEWGLASERRMFFSSMFEQIENMRRRYPFLYDD